MFNIPTLPVGRRLTFNILSTWGDPYYVGLMGIELFDGSGYPIHLDNVSQQLWADPPDINILPEYDNDPRVIENLVDGFNYTADDLHAWLAPFTPGSNHYIYMVRNSVATKSPSSFLTQSPPFLGPRKRYMHLYDSDLELQQISDTLAQRSKIHGNIHG